ncbi:thiamine-phosphate kinase [Frateuria sp. MAH-13]|uniref:Thiamine-monophosphate kinase n=1 Tax=Frateuria flava TaxID=2821489 RepID=A0ABS4DK65_9GAMM|nr:thiamine-phosphate kinase [Frateuria flava]MBP1473438.1 thiamine-phosphate kinase [Frateuria flava]
MEFRLIDRIRDRTALTREDVRLGIGDDAAVLAVPAGQQLAVAIDTLVEGVHFPHGTAPRDIGWKALAVNLSDLAAMGAVPAWALLALTVPHGDAAIVDGLAGGFGELARQHAVALVGGDTTRGPFCLSVAVHGFVPPGQAMTRSGARAGDALFVTGSLGSAAGGLQLLQGRVPFDANNEAHRTLRERLDRPTPRVRAGVALRGHASACIDVSDGLLADLGHICAASGVGAALDLDALPLSTALHGVFGGDVARELALTGGDDYELCFTVPPGSVDAMQAALAAVGAHATRIGAMVEGQGVRAIDGAPLAAMRMGWDHFGA